MLSDQLIKNNTVALTELAKNSYDADASWVQIRIGNMKNFGKKGLSDKEKPFVEIEDDGDGMSFETIRDSWMNPASPDKFKRRQSRKVRTRRGRVIQGEKGIGRYAVFQIGKKVEIYTRERISGDKGGKEIYLITDLSEYTEELLSRKKAKHRAEPVYLDEIESRYQIRGSPRFIKPGAINIEGKRLSRKNHGTLIRITELRYGWTLPNVKKIREILWRLQSPFRRQDFAVSIVFQGDHISVLEAYELEDVLDEALLEMTGEVDKLGRCVYSLKRGKSEERGRLNLVEHLKQDAVPTNRSHFYDRGGGKPREPVCGPFRFKFYVYDIYTMTDKELKEYIRAHRLYIYRDDIRVYPYGDRDNDWMKLDIYRGLVRASYYFSNDQLIGYVDISSERNPKLRDKTNREGLLEQGTAYEDLRFLTLSALNYLHAEYQRAKLAATKKAKRLRERKSELYLQTEKVEKNIGNLDRHLKKVKDDKGKKLIATLTDEYLKERNIYRRQIEIVEDLAGVGIAVDATSHDLMLMMNRANERIKEIQTMIGSEEVDLERLSDKADALGGLIASIAANLSGIQPLFRSARRRRKELRISDIVKTVMRYYETPIKKARVQVEIKEVGPPLTITSSEGILLQLFINLMDNSVYWLRVSDVTRPKIEVVIDGEKGSVIFADNGPGVEEKYVDYIFEPFFSTKGLQSRGLGLYIARQLTDKYDYDLYYLNKKPEQILPGANFRIDFIEQGGR